MSQDKAIALRTARMLLELGHSLDAVIGSTLIPEEYKGAVSAELLREQNVTLVPAKALVADRTRKEWLQQVDRSTWTYWPSLRQYLLARKGWSAPSVRSLDDSSDRILRCLESPSQEHFDVRGLVLGFVQSGKTANYTALIAKAADSGYRLVVVLSGIDNGLRRQTQLRLKNELVGYDPPRPGAVALPPVGLQWHEFTSTDLDGDFRPGLANHAALQGSQPVLLVIKKNGSVLRRLLAWLNEAPADVLRMLPCLVIDDEADQASVDTRGSRQADGEDEGPDYEAPSVINGLIRDLLNRCGRSAYVAYTATPFANILIPHDTVDPTVRNDLYPKDFIIDLPRPDGYFGAEEFFGRVDEETGEVVGGIDVIRDVSDEDLQLLEEGGLPASLRLAVMDFALAGAARAARGDGDAPATMLVHASSRIERQAHLKGLVEGYFNELRDEWRYQREHGIRHRLESRWEEHFRPITRRWHAVWDQGFRELEDWLSTFLEAVAVREVNSATGEVLDYEREPTLKAIAVGGNRLSRGLTLEGLLVSYFVRRSVTYDTLMQMGRWFGFRKGYEDLVRIVTTGELASWFSDLAFVEHRLRSDIAIYESQGLTPLALGTRIWQHPAMQVTSAVKRRFATSTVISQSYSLQLEQTFKFPLNRPEVLAGIADQGLDAVRALVGRLGPHDREVSDAKGPVWREVDLERVLSFLTSYAVDDRVRSMSLPLIRAYIERVALEGELKSWVVAVRGRGRADRALGKVDWGWADGDIDQISRSRLKHTESLGVITSPGDEAIGLPQELVEAAKSELGMAMNPAARARRNASEGLLLLYPISRYSGYEASSAAGNRAPLYEDPMSEHARDLVGVAISFPRSGTKQGVEAYLEGTVGWSPVV